MNAASKGPTAAPEFTWPDPPLEIALVEPEIPPNTGNIARLCAATGSTLHLVGPLGFKLSDRSVKRAGLDYWPHVRIVQHDDLAAFLAAVDPGRCVFYSTRGTRLYVEADYRPGQILVFGSETRGLPDSLLHSFSGQVLTIPMQRRRVRSLNLANAVSIVLYEALRQIAARG